MASRSRMWVRWMALHGVARMVLGGKARRGDPLANLLAGPECGVNPYPWIEALRAEGRVVRTPMVSVTVDYELTRTILRDSRFRATKPSDLGLPRPIRWLLDHTGEGIPNPFGPPAMVAVDPPEHTRYRRLVAQAFTPRAIRALETRIVELADQLLAAMETCTESELIADFAAQLPAAVIAGILGVPDDLSSKLLEWGNLGAPLLDAGVGWHAFRDGVDGLTEAGDYFAEHAERLRRDPGEDILSSVVAHGDLTAAELSATSVLMMGAGFETTMNLIGNGVVLLLRNPDQLDLVRADPTLWPNVVEEIVRLESPAQMTRRTARVDVELDGHLIRAGEVVVLHLGGANRDPRKFENPTAFDITRAGLQDHLAYGSGIHTCLGAHLARMEGTLALRALFERFPDMRLLDEPVARGLGTLHGFDQVQVTLGAHRDGRLRNLRA